MTLEEIYYIGQTIAVVAILASLVGIYWQQRKDHALAKAESQRAISQQASQLFDDLVENPSSLDSLQQCMRDYRGANVRQKTEFVQFILKHIMLSEQSTYMDTTKLIHDGSRDKIITLTAMYLSTPGGQQYWEDSKVAFTDETIAAIDQEMLMNPVPIEEVLKVLPHVGEGVLVVGQAEINK